MLVLMTDRTHAQIHLLFHPPSSFLLPLPGTQREDRGARTQRPTGKSAHTRRHDPVQHPLFQLYRPPDKSSLRKQLSNTHHTLILLPLEKNQFQFSGFPSELGHP